MKDYQVDGYVNERIGVVVKDNGCISVWCYMNGQEGVYMNKQKEFVYE